MLAAAQDSYYVGITFSNVIIRHVAHSIEAVMAMGLQLLLGAVPLGTWAWEHPASARWSPRFGLVLAGLALGGTALPYWLCCSVVEKTELSRANGYTFLVPLLGLAMGFIFCGERLVPFAAAGAGLAILGTWRAQLPGAPRR